MASAALYANAAACPAASVRQWQPALQLELPSPSVYSLNPSLAASCLFSPPASSCAAASLLSTAWDVVGPVGCLLLQPRLGGATISVTVFTWVVCRNALAP